MKDLLQNQSYAIYRSIRKPLPPKTRVERPRKGKLAYQRPKNDREIYEDA